MISPRRNSVAVRVTCNVDGQRERIGSRDSFRVVGCARRPWPQIACKVFTVRTIACHEEIHFAAVSRGTKVASNDPAKHPRKSNSYRGLVNRQEKRGKEATMSRRLDLITIETICLAGFTAKERIGNRVAAVRGSNIYSKTERSGEHTNLTSQ